MECMKCEDMKEPLKKIVGVPKAQKNKYQTVNIFLFINLNRCFGCSSIEQFHQQGTKIPLVRM